MRGVTGERAHAGKGLIDPLQHLIHRLRQVGDLVPGFGYRQTDIEIAISDAARFCRQRGDGRERLAAQEVPANR